MCRALASSFLNGAISKHDGSVAAERLLKSGMHSDALPLSRIRPLETRFQAAQQNSCAARLQCYPSTLSVHDSCSSLVSCAHIHIHALQHRLTGHLLHTHNNPRKTHFIATTGSWHQIHNHTNVLARWKPDSRQPSPRHGLTRKAQQNPSGCGLPGLELHNSTALCMCSRQAWP